MSAGLRDYVAEYQSAIAAAEARPKLNCPRCERAVVLDTRGIFTAFEPLCEDCLAKAAAEEQKREAFQRFRERQADSGLPTELHNLRLSDYDPAYNSPDHTTVKQRRDVKALFLSYCTPDFPKHGAVLVGPAGTGKTHLTAALCNRFCYHGYTPRWLDGRELDHLVTAEWGKSNRERFFQTRLAEEIALHEVVFIEDLQVPSATPPGWYVNALSDIVNQLAIRRRLLFVSTNHRRRADLVTCDGQPVRGQQRELYLEKAYGEAVTSRIAGLCKFYPLAGPDLRQL